MRTLNESGKPYFKRVCNTRSPSITSLLALEYSDSSARAPTKSVPSYENAWSHISTTCSILNFLLCFLVLILMSFSIRILNNCSYVFPLIHFIAISFNTSVFSHLLKVLLLTFIDMNGQITFSKSLIVLHLLNFCECDLIHF